MKKLTKAQVKAIAKKEGSVRVLIIPNKTNPNNIWGIGFKKTIYSANKGQNVVVYGENDPDEIMDLETYLAHFSYYNCNSELGNRISFYQV